MLERFKKGNTPAGINAPTATTWDEFRPDDYDGSADGDDSVHHNDLEPLITKEALTKHIKEAGNG